MSSYRYYSNIDIDVDIEEKAAAKEKNKRLLKEFFSPLAAKNKKSVNNQKLLQTLHGSGASRDGFLEKSLTGRRGKNQKEEEPWHYLKM